MTSVRQASQREPSQPIESARERIAIASGTTSPPEAIRGPSDCSILFADVLAGNLYSMTKAVDAMRKLFAGSKLLESADHLHVMGSALSSPALLEMVRTALRSVRSWGGTVSFDPNLRKEILAAPGMRESLEHVLAHTDLFLPSGSELYLLSEATDETVAVQDLRANGVRTIVIKNGAEGSVCHDANGRRSAPAFPVGEVDATGAGDTFSATFVTCWLRGYLLSTR